MYKQLLLRELHQYKEWETLYKRKEYDYPGQFYPVFGPLDPSINCNIVRQSAILTLLNLFKDERYTFPDGKIYDSKEFNEQKSTDDSVETGRSVGDAILNDVMYTINPVIQITLPHDDNLGVTFYMFSSYQSGSAILS